MIGLFLYFVLMVSLTVMVFHAAIMVSGGYPRTEGPLDSDLAERLLFEEGVDPAYVRCQNLSEHRHHYLTDDPLWWARLEEDPDLRRRLRERGTCRRPEAPLQARPTHSPPPRPTLPEPGPPDTCVR